MKNNDLKKTLNFLEELSWILQSHKNLNLSEFVNELKYNEEKRNRDYFKLNYSNSGNEKARLIGILPGLLNDKKLFERNSDLIDFAESTFEIRISRPEKRSRYEIVGLVIMELYNSNHNDLVEITDSIQLLLSNSSLKTQLRNRKGADNFSWNKAIREITNQ